MPAIENEEQLDDRLSKPTDALVEVLGRHGGDLIILGVGGKMGPTLARMARRASDAAGTGRRVIGVSRFSDPSAREKLEGWGVETIAGDVMDAPFLASLPDAPLVVYMVGMKFGTSGGEARTWASNAYLPALVCQRYAQSRISAFSTGNVYGRTPVEGNAGSVESDVLEPVGEYAMSCLGRERIFEYFSREQGTRVALIRLNYATELRYGVLVDLALQVHRGQPIDMTTGYANVIWQADASATALCALDHASDPPFYLNVTGPEVFSCRRVAEQLAERMGSDATFVGEESPTALLSDASRSFELYGKPRVGLDELIAWTADWVSHDRPTTGKPTHFEVRDGKF